MARVTFKRQYTSAHPAKRVNANARVRNQVIEFVARKGSVTLEELEAFVKEVAKSGKSWLKTKNGLFKITEEEGVKTVKLSRTGSKIYDSVMLKESDSSFLSFEEFTGLNDADKKKDEVEEDDDEKEDDEDLEREEEIKDKEEDDKDEEEEEEIDENRLLKQSKLSSAEYQKAKKLKGFNKDDYKWDSDQDLYVKESVVNENLPKALKAWIASGGKDSEEVEQLAKQQGREKAIKALIKLKLDDEQEEEYTDKLKAMLESKVTCPKCDGEGCDHCDGKGYHMMETNEAKLVPVKRVKKGGEYFATDRGYAEDDMDKVKVTKIKKNSSGDYDVDVEFISGDMKGDKDSWYLEVDDKVFFTESVNERFPKMKRVTKQMWSKFSDDEKEQALWTAVKDPDDAAEYIDSKWDQLPDEVTSNMYIESSDSISENFVVYLTNEMGVKMMKHAQVKTKKEAKKMADELMDQDTVQGAGWMTAKEWDKTDKFYKVSSLESFDPLSESIAHEEDLQILEARNGMDEDLIIPADLNEASNIMFDAFVKFRQVLEANEISEENIAEYREIRKEFEKFEDKLSK